MLLIKVLVYNQVCSYNPFIAYHITLMADLINFTKEMLLKLPIPTPAKKAVTYRDTKEKGLILIVSYGGSKVFYLSKRVKNTENGKSSSKRIKIGVFPDLSVADAKEKVIELKSQIAKGKYLDSRVARNNCNTTNELTFKQLFDKYIEEYAKRKIKGWKTYLIEMEQKGKSLYQKPISSITRDDIGTLFTSIPSNIKARSTGQSGHVAANRFLEKLRAIFNKAIEWELLAKNPANGIEKYKEHSRDRYITSEEKSLFLQALSEVTEVTKDFLLVSLFTGARKSNVLAMSWNEIDFNNDSWTIPREKSKNAMPHTIHLHPKLMQLLQRRKDEAPDRESTWVFASMQSKSGHLESPGSAWLKILDSSGLKDLRIHDLRRTFATWMLESGNDLHMISKALGHKSQTITGIYAKVSPKHLAEKVCESLNNALGNIDIDSLVIA